MDYKKHFKRTLAKRFPEMDDLILSDADKRYVEISTDTNFGKKSANPLDKRLDLMAYFLATIQALQRRNVDFQKIKYICTEIASEYVKPKNRLQRWLRKLPLKLVNTKLANLFLKVLGRKINKKGHVDGFLAELITDKTQTYGFGYGIDILECGVCKLFGKHGAEQFTPILCEVDKITSILAGLELIRTGTIATGADKCDFRFKKK